MNSVNFNLNFDKFCQVVITKDYIRMPITDDFSITGHVMPMFNPKYPKGREPFTTNINVRGAGYANEGKHYFLTKHLSTEDLRDVVRNVHVDVEGKGIMSWADLGGEDSKAYVEKGRAWQRVVIRSEKIGVQLAITNFVPVGKQMELM